MRDCGGEPPRLVLGCVPGTRPGRPSVTPSHSDVSDVSVHLGVIPPRALALKLPTDCWGLGIRCTLRDYPNLPLPRPQPQRVAPPTALPATPSPAPAIPLSSLRPMHPAVRHLGSRRIHSAPRNCCIPNLPHHTQHSPPTLSSRHHHQHLPAWMHRPQGQNRCLPARACYRWTRPYHWARASISIPRAPPCPARRVGHPPDSTSPCPQAIAALDWFSRITAHAC